MGTRLLQQAQFARGGFATADDERPAPLEVEKDREVIHAIRSLWPGLSAGTH
jgi:hypothetical protein